MGYTRYWDFKGNPPDKNKFKHFSHLCKLVVENMDIPVEDITITDDKVRFNGVGDDAHETFLITSSQTNFNFCKTQLKPYDDLVCACLEFARNIFGDGIEVDSDGDNNDEEVKAKIRSLIRDRKLEYLLDGKTYT